MNKTLPLALKQFGKLIYFNILMMKENNIIDNICLYFHTNPRKHVSH